MDARYAFNRVHQALRGLCPNLIRPASWGLLLLTTFMPVLSQALAVAPPFEVRGPDFPTYTFSEQVPPEFTADTRSKLSVSDRYYRGGAGASLRWEWSQPGSAMTFRHEDAFRHLTGEQPDPIVYEWVTFCGLSGMSLWVFSEQPIDDELRFEIGDGQSVDVQFTFRLDFSGWRELAFLYGRDLERFPNQETATTLTVRAPQSVAEGALHFSHFAPRREMDVRRVKPTGQAPWVRPLETKKRDFLELPLPGQLEESQRAELQDISERFLARYGQASRAARVDPAKVRARYALKRDGRFVSGTIDHGIAFWGVVSDVAAAYHAAGEQPALRQTLLDLYLDLVDLWIQHGSARTYALRDSFGSAVLWMREELKDHERFEPLLENLREAVETEDFYSRDARADADLFNTQLLARLFTVLIQDDGPGKWRDLMAVQGWLERVSEHGALQSDGTMLHHQMVYTGYSFPAIGPLVDAVHLLHETSFASPKMHRAARQAAHSIHVYAGHAGAPHFFSGRHRNSPAVSWSMARMFARLADCGNPGSGGEIDKEMARIFMHYAEQYAPEAKRNAHAARFTSLGLDPASSDGHWAIPYAVANIHRRADWMVAVRGQKSGLFANELYSFQGRNTMGRFLNYGHLLIYSAGDSVRASDSGFAPDRGWDYSLWPGTTVRHLPHEVLRSRFMVEEMITAEPFAGGVHLDGNGVFGMKLAEELPGSRDARRIGPPRYWLGDEEYFRRIAESGYDPAFHARKSWFFFDGHIVCLGSGIASGDENHPTVTVLFQNSLTEEARDRVPFPEQATLSPEAAIWLRDAYGRAYYLPPGNDSIRVERRRQQLPYHANWNPRNPRLHQEVRENEGDTEWAVINHGPRPRSAGYEYCVLVDGTEDRMEDFAKDIPYEVLRRDEGAHVVRDRESRTTAYVLFDTAAPVGEGLVQTASSPCVLAAREVEPGRIRLSFSNPDLGEVMYAEGPAKEQAQEASVTLRGAWDAELLPPEVQLAHAEGPATVLTFRTSGAQVVQVELAEP